MKNILLLTLTILLCFGCKDTKSSQETDNQLVAASDTTDCVDTVAFGDTTFCLPKIEGMTQGYDDPIIKAKADEFDDPQNTILAYYVPTAVFKQRDSLAFITYDNYYKVYTSNMAKNYEMKPAEVQEVMRGMTGGMMNSTIAEVNEDFKNSNKPLEIGQPTLVEKYEGYNNSSTAIVLMGLTKDTVDKVMAIAMNVLLVKDRLVFMAHYLDYNGQASIEQLKENNSNFLKEFYKVNS